MPFLRMYICVKYLRQSITKVGLGYLRHQYHIKKPHSPVTFLYFLPHFENLTHLVRYNFMEHRDYGNYNPLLMFEALNNFTALITFEYYNTFPTPSDVELSRLLSTINHHHISRNLKNFRLHFQRFITKPCMFLKFILPNKLDKLEMTIHGYKNSKLVEWIYNDDHLKTLMMILVKGMKSIKDLYFSPGTNRHMANQP